MNADEVKNLEAISKAIDQHNQNCKRGPAVEVRMNPFELERLGWDEIKGVPIVGDEKIGTGRFRVVCAGERSGKDEAEATEAVSADREGVVEKDGDLLKVA
jgi:hypothetical protein